MTADRAVNVCTFNSLWEQRQMPFPFPSSDYSVNIMGPSAPTANKTKTPKNFPWCPNPEGHRETFFHTRFLHTYTYNHHRNEWSTQTITHSQQDESVNRICFRVRLRHSAPQLLSQAAAGSVGDR